MRFFKPVLSDEVQYVNGKHIYTIPEANGLGIGIAADVLAKRDFKAPPTTSDTDALVANLDVGTETTETSTPGYVVHHDEIHRPYYVKPQTIDNSLLNVTAVVGDTTTPIYAKKA